MIEEAMNSKVKGRIVKFLSQQTGEFQVSDLARLLKVSKSRASETLRELSDMGVLSSRNVGRSVLYRFSSSDMARTIRDSVNSDSTLLENIENNVIKETSWLKPVSTVRFGSSLRGLKPHSDVDFLIIHKKPAKKEKIYEIVAKLSSRFGIHISIILMKENDFVRKARSGDEFVLNAMAGKLIHGTDMEDVVWHEK